MTTEELVEKYKKTIDDIYTEISTERASCDNHLDGITTSYAYGLEVALKIINKHTGRSE